METSNLDVERRRALLRDQIGLQGLAATARAVGCSKQALACFVAGLPVHRGTQALMLAWTPRGENELHAGAPRFEAAP